MRRLGYFLALLPHLVAFSGSGSFLSPTFPISRSVHFAVVGDYGNAGQSEADVANLIHSWNPDFIITTGDNNYPEGEASTIDSNVGQYYHDFIYPYAGSYGPGAIVNRFFPALGFHDWVTAGAQPYLDYFTLPHNERYYTFTWGPVQIFTLDSNPEEPDGITSDSIQAHWLQTQLRSSMARWKLISVYHPPFSSGTHGSVPALQWPFRTWGATAVLSGHDHTYERIVRDGMTYFVNGLGGTGTYEFQTPVRGSQVRYSDDFGAMLVQADDTHIVFHFISRSGAVIDTYSLTISHLPLILKEELPKPRHSLETVER